MTTRDIRIEDMPAAFCKARCNAWNERHGCRSRRWQEVCDHPERLDAGKYQNKKGWKNT